MRKLATIRKIDDIKPIAGADMIETALIGGWEVIVKKNEFKIGDYCIYFEIDSFFQSQHPLIKGKIDHLLAKGEQRFQGDLLSEKDKIFNNVKPEDITGFRIKTIKMKGQISQGYVMPLNIFKGQLDFNENDIIDYSIDGEKDLSHILGILKYDASYSSQNGGKSFSNLSQLSNFPHFIPKTDAERIQNIGLREFLTDGFVDTPLDITIKYDGSSMTVYITDNMDYVKSLGKQQEKNVINMNKDLHIGICSRNYEIAWKENPNSSGGYDENHFTKLGYNVAQVLKSYYSLKNLDLPRNIALQGEIISPNIQGNFESVKWDEYHIFNIYDIQNKQYLSISEKEAVISILMNIAQEMGFNDFFHAVKNATGNMISQEPKTILEYINVKPEDFYFSKNIIQNQLENFEEEMLKMKKWIKEAQKFFLNEADGKGYINNYREGIVMKPITGNGLIFKAISNHYLLKHEK